MACGAKFARAVHEADRTLLKDFVFGVEFGDAPMIVLGPLNQLYTDLSRYISAGATGSIALPPEIVLAHGKRLVDVLREYAIQSYDDPARMDTDRHAISLSSLPRFNFTSGLMLALERPALVQKRLDQIAKELSAPIKPSDERRTQLESEREALRVEQANHMRVGVNIDAVTWRQIDRVIELLRAHQQRQIDHVDHLTFLLAFGEVQAPDNVSTLLKRRIAELDASEKEIIRRNQEVETRIDENDRRAGEYRVVAKRIESLRKEIAERQTRAAEAERELSTLDVRFYEQTYEYASRPENSGVLDLDPMAVAALDLAKRMAADALGSPHTALDELITNPRYTSLFAQLAGRIRKLGGMTSGRTYSQPEQVLRADVEVETLLSQHFASLGSRSSSNYGNHTQPPIWEVERQLQLQYSSNQRQPGLNPAWLVNRDGSSAFHVPARGPSAFF